MANIGLEIVTPDRKFYEDEVEMVVLKTIEGDMGVLRDHVPTVVPLSIGSLKIKKDGKFRQAACAGGFVNITEESITVITDAAEWPDEIDRVRAEAAKKRAEERLNDKKDHIDFNRARMALAKAINRITMSEMK